MNIVNAPLGKRIIAVFIDLFLAFALFFVFHDLVVSPAFGAWSNKMVYYEKYEEYFEDVPLYEYNDVSGTYNEVKEEKYTVALEQFYDNYIITMLPESEYGTWQDIILNDEDGSAIYELVEGEITLKEGVTEEEVAAYLSNKFDEAIKIFYAIPEIADVVMHLNAFALMETGISIFLSFLILYLIIPLLFKKGRTIGKRLMNLAVVNKYGYKISVMQLIIRFVTLLFFEVTLGIFTFFLSIFISFTMMVFNKKNMTLHDFFSVTMVIDAKKSVFFADKNQEEEFNKKIDSKSEEIMEEKVI